MQTRFGVSRLAMLAYGDVDVEASDPGQAIRLAQRACLPRIALAARGLAR